MCVGPLEAAVAKLDLGTTGGSALYEHTSPILAGEDITVHRLDRDHRVNTEVVVSTMENKKDGDDEESKSAEILNTYITEDTRIPSGILSEKLRKVAAH